MSTKVIDGKIVTNTLCSSFLQATKLLEIDMVYKKRTTLNEHLRINDGIMPGPREYGVMGYFCIGNKGHSQVCDEFLSPLPIRHQPTDVAPYGLIPIALRPVAKDLDDRQREKFCLRREEEINGAKHFSYYGYRFERRGITTENYITTVENGNETTDIFEYTDINLFPKPSEMPDYDYEVSDAVVPDDGDYVSAFAKVVIQFDEFLIGEIQNVAKILYNNPMAAVVSEITLFAGVDKQATGTSATGSPFQYNEVFGAQSMIHCTTFMNLALQNKGVTFTFNIGQTIPMALAPGQTPDRIVANGKAQNPTNVSLTI